MNPFEMIKNFQNLQSGMAEMQEKLKDVVVTGSAGGDMVRVTINGKMEIQNVEISPEAVDPDDIKMLEDLMEAAFRDAMTRVREQIQQEVSSLTGGMELPPNMFGA
ncbi:MAG: YbaB/EbfC family nucleoid-associated protein [Spirochaetales bacterium]|nr:YbaB/EbfC family nucleoid-associated protein [Spirochaetales bacterium]MCF7939773.1 YbaB/EbfC family nucleoid-associated protein [Spirochaetales bacterium]